MLNVLSNTIEFTANQRTAVEHRGGNLLVEAVPGSGKTQVIVARCASLLNDGASAASILLLTFSRRAAGELQSRLARALPDRALPEVQTFHGFAARLLALAGDRRRSRRLLAGEAERLLFEHVVATTPLRALPTTIMRWPPIADALAVQIDAIRRAPASARADLSTRATSRLADLLALATARGALRDRLGVADYDDLIAQAVIYASSAETRARELRARYRHILVDEFQDTDALQLALLRQLGGELFAVGDPAQAIYGFRGAARDALQRAREQFGMRTLALDQSFRCPQIICDAARSVWPRQPALQSALEAPGSLSVRRAASPADEAAFIANAIVDARARGVPAREIAVLVRTAEPLARLVERELADRGVASFRHGGEALTDDRAVDAICRALDVFCDPTDGRRWVRCLTHPVFGFPALAMRLALDATPPRSIDDAAALLAPFATSTLPPGRFSTALAAAHARWEAGDPVGAARTFAAEANVLGYLVAGDEIQAQRSGRRITHFLDALDDVADMRRQLGLDVDARRVYEGLRNSRATPTTDADSADDAACVRILTVHSAKGLEFEVVVIADAVETRFPQVWRAEPLLSPHDITLARGCGIALGTTLDEHLAEERSLWYVATTRAKRELVVTWSEVDLVGSPQRPSRFIAPELRALEDQRPAFRAPLVFEPAPGLARPQAPRPARLTRPVATRSVENWIACRRQFYYRDLVRIRTDERGLRAVIGTLVHRTIAIFHAQVRDFRFVNDGAAAGWKAQLHTIVRAVAADGATLGPFGSAIETSAIIRAADRLLERYARALETQSRPPNAGFEVVSTEERVTYVVGDIHMSGVIDRIDRLATGALSIVDIKTGALKGEIAMRMTFPKFAAAVAEGQLWVKAMPAVQPQLALYRHAKPQAASLAYLYLGARPKAKDYRDDASADSIDCAADADVLDALQAALSEIFFTPWAAGTLTAVAPTRYARTCRRCDFIRVCPGYLEEDD